MSKKFKRSIILVNPKFQFSFIKHSFFMTLFVLITFYLFKIYIFWEIKDIAYETGVPHAHDFVKILDQRSFIIDISFLILAINVICMIAAWGLWLSHRVAGPIYRIRNEVKKIVEGRPLSRINIRDHDYFHDLKDSINLLIEHFRR